MKNNDSTQIMKKSGNKTVIIIAASVIGVAALGAVAYFGFFSSNPWFVSKEKKELKAEVVQDPYSIQIPETEITEEESLIDLDSLMVDSLYIDTEDWSDTPKPEVKKVVENKPGVPNKSEQSAKTDVKETPVQPKTESSQSPANNDPVPVAMTDEKPMFPGGDSAMYKWLSQHITYPPSASEEGVSGKVTVSFIIETDGSITNVRVVRGKHSALDKEAVNVVKKMPRWNPGKINGKPVRVTYLFPVNFQLQ